MTAWTQIFHPKATYSGKAKLIDGVWYFQGREKVSLAPNSDNVFTIPIHDDFKVTENEDIKVRILGNIAYVI